MRVGIGEDLHRLEEGRRLVLGGVTIEGDVGLAGHSDADVLLHAIADAVLGAAGLGDLGAHFPSSDERWAGADSGLFLTGALRIAGESGWALADRGAGGRERGAGECEGEERRRAGRDRPRRGYRGDGGGVAGGGAVAGRSTPPPGGSCS